MAASTAWLDSQAVVEAKGRTTVLIGVRGAKFEAMEYARHAEKIGADGLHALSPTDGFSGVRILDGRRDGHGAVVFRS